MVVERNGTDYKSALATLFNSLMGAGGGDDEQGQAIPITIPHRMP